MSDASPDVSKEVPLELPPQTPQHELPASQAAVPAMPDEAVESAATPAPSRLAVVEVLDRDGRGRHSVAVHEWPFTIGRALDNDLVLDDPHVAPHHLSLAAGTEGRVLLQVRPSINGVGWGRRRLGAPTQLELQPVRPGGSVPPRPEVVLGATRLRIRLAADAVEPERALPQRARLGATLLLALVLWGWMVAEQAIQSDPGASAGDWLRPLLTPPAAIVIWCMLWGLASKLFQHRFDFWAHLAVAVPGLLAAEATSLVLPWLSAIFGWPGFSRLTLAATSAVAVLWLLAHARLVLPQQRRALVFTAAAAYAAGVAILFTLNQQRYERWFAELYSSRLPPPGLAWHRAVPPADFVRAAGQLQAPLQRRVGDDAEPKGGDEEE